jgi:hypothetical protein
MEVNLLGKTNERLHVNCRPFERSLLYINHRIIHGPSHTDLSAHPPFQ